MNRLVRKTILTVATFILFLLSWQAYVSLFTVPAHILPAPIQFFQEFIRYFASGDIYSHIGTTLYEIIAGFFIGTFSGLVIGYLVAKNKFLERIITPYVILLQTIPKISIAPLFLLWFGLGVSSKIALVALVVFFPIMINFIVGLRSVEKNMGDLLTILRANRWQKFISVEMLIALPFIMSGVKVATTYAITGAVIGELIGAQSGLGYLVILGSETYDINLILIAVVILCIIGIVLYLFVDFLEKKIIYWNKSQDLIL
ncbi:ABC transporter permease [Metabacillus idriensis]|uniref:ABC transporter permease n=1 Tax=Metabacillus idriensis TaxID=324768 RepID=UPI001749D92B|nr:ABC transporter permease [Metabacillus idriensis]